MSDAELIAETNLLLKQLVEDDRQRKAEAEKTMAEQPEEIGRIAAALSQHKR